MVLNPLWVRLDQQVHQEYGVERLYLVSGAAISRSADFWVRTKGKLAKPWCRTRSCPARVTFNPVAKADRKSVVSHACTSYIHLHDDTCHT